MPVRVGSTGRALDDLFNLLTENCLHFSGTSYYDFHVCALQMKFVPQFSYHSKAARDDKHVRRSIKWGRTASFLDGRMIVPVSCWLWTCSCDLHVNCSGITADLSLSKHASAASATVESLAAGFYSLHLPAWPAVSKRVKSLRLEVKVAGSIPSTTAQRL